MTVDTIKTALGIDVGLEKFLATADGEIVPIQQTYTKAQHRLVRQPRKLAYQHKASANYKKQANRVAIIN